MILRLYNRRHTVWELTGFLPANSPTHVSSFFGCGKDQNTPSQMRSYISNDGRNFTLIDSLNGLAGSFGIRAVVTFPGP